MSSQTIHVRLEVPEGVSEQARKEAEQTAREAAVLALWQRGQITIRQAAEELGLSYYDFLDLLSARGIPVEQGPLNLSALEEARRKLAGTRTQ